jgi:uncharacterized protein
MKRLEMLVGLISDTHGLLRPQAVDALRGSDFIIHAGDIGDRTILDELALIAPLTVVRGNNDAQSWAGSIAPVEVLQVGAATIYVIHDLAEMDIDPRGSFDVVVSGHSHKPTIATRDEVLYVNPGSAGPRRFRLPISVARVRISGAKIEPELIELSID